MLQPITHSDLGVKMFKILLVTFGDKLIIKGIKVDDSLSGQRYNIGNVSISFGVALTDICITSQTIKVYIRTTPTQRRSDIDTLAFVTLSNKSHAKTIANTVYDALNALIKAKPNLKGSYVEIVSDIFDNINFTPNSCLKINGLKIDTYLFIQIADMKDSDVHKTLRTPNGFCLSSVATPEISAYDMTLYVRGRRKEFDNHVCCENFGDISLLRKYIANLKLAVKQWNNDNNDNNVTIYDFLFSP